MPLLPHQRTGPQTTLKSLYWLNLCALVSKGRYPIDPTPSSPLQPPLHPHQITSVPSPSSSASPPQSPLHPYQITSQRQWAYSTLTKILGKPPEPLKSRQELYKSLLHCSSITTSRQREICRKVSLLASPSGNWGHLMSNWERLPTSLPDMYRVNQLKTIYKAYNTHMRVRHWSKRSDLSCTFCLVDEESYKHFFDSCPVVKAAWDDIQVEFGTNLTLSFQLISLLTHISTMKELCVILAFNYATWRVRNDHLHDPSRSAQTKTLGIRNLTITCYAPHRGIALRGSVEAIDPSWSRLLRKRLRGQ